MKPERRKGNETTDTVRNFVSCKKEIRIVVPSSNTLLSQRQYVSKYRQITWPELTELPLKTGMRTESRSIKE